MSRELTSPSDHSDPTVVLSDDNHIGHCWCFPSTHGQVGITLPDFIYPTNVSIDHIPVELAAIPGQAPRRMVLWGVVDGDRNTALYHQFSSVLRNNLTIAHLVPPIILKGEAEMFVVLAEIEYDIHLPAVVQTFSVRTVVQDSDIDVGQIVLEVLDNWGADSTCLYRVRLHGERSA